MSPEQKKQLIDYFQDGLYTAVCINNDTIFKSLYPQNIVELEMNKDSIFHKETVMIKKDVFLKKDEPYKLVFPVQLKNLEYFTIMLSSTNKQAKDYIACYENTLNSILIKSNIDVLFKSIILWTHQNHGIKYL